jgi:hypothetical protein
MTTKTKSVLYDKAIDRSANMKKMRMTLVFYMWVSPCLVLLAHTQTENRTATQYLATLIGLNCFGVSKLVFSVLMYFMFKLKWCWNNGDSAPVVFVLTCGTSTYAEHLLAAFPSLCGPTHPKPSQLG